MDAEKSLQRCKAAGRHSRESEHTAAAEAQQLHQDKLQAAEALAACDGALKKASQRLARLEQDTATEKEASSSHIQAHHALSVRDDPNLSLQRTHS